MDSSRKVQLHSLVDGWIEAGAVWIGTFLRAEKWSWSLNRPWHYCSFTCSTNGQKPFCFSFHWDKVNWPQLKQEIDITMFSSDGKQSRISRIKRDFKIQRCDGNDNVEKQQLCTCSTRFCIFLCRFCRLRRENAYIWQSKCVRIIAINTERMQTYVLSDVLVAVASLDLKAPDRRRERDCLNYPLKSWERRGFPCSRSQASGKDKAGFSRGHNYLKHQIHHVFAQVHYFIASLSST